MKPGNKSDFINSSSVAKCKSFPLKILLNLISLISKSPLIDTITSSFSIT